MRFFLFAFLVVLIVDDFLGSFLLVIVSVDVAYYDSFSAFLISLFLELLDYFIVILGVGISNTIFTYFLFPF
jgi:hypothetical protein